MSVWCFRSTSSDVLCLGSLPVQLFLLSHLRSQAKDIFGGDWIQRHRKIVQQNANQYKRVAWAMVSASSAWGVLCFFSVLLLGVKTIHLLAVLSFYIMHGV